MPSIKLTTQVDSRFTETVLILLEEKTGHQIYWSALECIELCFVPNLLRLQLALLNYHAQQLLRALTHDLLMLSEPLEC